MSKRPATKSAIVKKPKSTSLDGFGILNPYGGFWSPLVFSSEVIAKAHFDKFWSQPGFEGQRPKWSDYKTVPARARINAIKAFKKT